MTPGGIQSNLIGGLLGAGAGGAWNHLHGKDVGTGAAYGGLLGAGLTHLTRGRWLNTLKQDLHGEIASNVLKHVPDNTPAVDYLKMVNSPPSGLEAFARNQSADSIRDLIDGRNFQRVLEYSSFSRL